MNLNQFLTEHGKKLTIAKHDHVFSQGDQDDSVYFVQSGLLKAYYLSSEGKERIKSFLKPGMSIGSLTCAHKGLPCSFSLLALKKSELVQVPFAKLRQASQTTLALADLLIESLLNLSMKKELREYEFLNLSAEERYRALCEGDPELLDQLTQNDVARYLGITPVALSRIKKRLS